MVPFRLHGTIERDSLPLLAGVPLLAGLWRKKRARTYWILSTAALVTVYALTDWDARRTDR